MHCTVDLKAAQDEYKLKGESVLVLLMPQKLFLPKRIMKFNDYH